MSEQNNGVLPRGVTQQEFNSAVEKFRALLGNENVLVEQQQLVPYNKIMMSVENAAHAPSAAVTATPANNVQGVGKICNAHCIPAWAISCGGYFVHGPAGPGQRGQVTRALKTTRKSVKVAPVMCDALVEPGATYGQMYD